MEKKLLISTKVIQDKYNRFIDSGDKPDNYHKDHLGSSSYLTDSEANIDEHTEYTPWGELWVRQRSVDVMGNSLNYYFTGKEMDMTGLYYFGARYYDPRISLWMSADPIIGKYIDDGMRWMRQGETSNLTGVFEPKNLSLYSYAHQNPIIMIDPDGKNPVLIIAAAIIVSKIYKIYLEPIHYQRNELQDYAIPKTKNEAMERGFEQFGAKNAELFDMYHEQGIGAEGNDKYTKMHENNISSMEAIYDEKGNLVTDSINKGTFNFIDGDTNFIGHFLLDMLPGFISGNDEVDAKTRNFIERVMGTYKGEIPKQNPNPSSELND